MSDRVKDSDNGLCARTLVIRSICLDTLRDALGTDLRKVNRTGFSLGDAGAYVEDRRLNVFAVLETPQYAYWGTILDEVTRSARQLVLRAVNLLSYVLDSPIEMADFDTQTQRQVSEAEESAFLHHASAQHCGYAGRIATRAQRLQDDDPEKARYLWSMLEHYRRSLMLSSMRETDDWKTPEAMFGFFKVAELAAEFHGSHLLARSRTSARKLIRSYLGECFAESMSEESALSGADREAEIIVTTALLSSSVVTQRRRIVHALSQMNMITPRLKHYVGEVVKARNRLAHADVVQFEPYRTGFHPPYYLFPESTQELWDFTKALAREVIARFVGVPERSHSLEEILNELPASPAEVDAFLSHHSVDSLPAEFFSTAIYPSASSGVFLWHLTEAKRGKPVILPYVERALGLATDPLDKAILLAEKLIIVRSQDARASTEKDLAELLYTETCDLWLRDEMRLFLNNYGIALPAAPVHSASGLTSEDG